MCILLELNLRDKDLWQSGGRIFASDAFDVHGKFSMTYQAQEKLASRIAAARDGVRQARLALQSFEGQLTRGQTESKERPNYLRDILSTWTLVTKTNSIYGYLAFAYYLAKAESPDHEGTITLRLGTDGCAMVDHTLKFCLASSVQPGSFRGGRDAMKPLMELVGQRVSCPISVNIEPVNSFLELESLARKTSVGEYDVAMMWGIEYGWLKEAPRVGTRTIDEGLQGGRGLRRAPCGEPGGKG